MHGFHLDLLEFSVKEGYTTLYCEHYILQARPNCFDLYLDIFIVHGGIPFTVCCVGCLSNKKKI